MSVNANLNAIVEGFKVEKGWTTTTVNKLAYKEAKVYGRLGTFRAVSLNGALEAGEITDLSLMVDKIKQVVGTDENSKLAVLGAVNKRLVFLNDQIKPGWFGGGCGPDANNTEIEGEIDKLEAIRTALSSNNNVSSSSSSSSSAAPVKEGNIFLQGAKLKPVAPVKSNAELILDFAKGEVAKSSKAAAIKSLDTIETRLKDSYKTWIEARAKADEFRGRKKALQEEQGDKTVGNVDVISGKLADVEKEHAKYAKLSAESLAQIEGDLLKFSLKLPEEKTPRGFEGLLGSVYADISSAKRAL